MRYNLIVVSADAESSSIKQKSNIYVMSIDKCQIKNESVRLTLSGLKVKYKPEYNRKIYNWNTNV